jgi:hypothetical protein
VGVRRCMLSSLSSLPCMRSASRVVGPRPVAHVRYCARNSGRERIACSIPDPVVGLWSGIYILQEQFRVPSADSLNATHAAYCQSPEQHASRGVLGIRQRMRSWVCRAGQGRSEQWWSLDAGYCIHIRRVLPFAVFPLSFLSARSILTMRSTRSLRSPLERKKFVGKT